MKMAFVHFVLAMILLFNWSNAQQQGPPPPGYYPSYKIGPIGFNQALRNNWGPQHQTLDDQGTLTIWIDQSYGGSGFKSLESYRSGYIGASIKLQPGYTAGIVTCLFVYNKEEHPEDHDEIDIEFLGTTPDKPYTLNTNIFVNGSRDIAQNITIGREVRFTLWFDPTQDYHHYAFLWNPSEILWFVDDVPIRYYPKKSDATFPQRPMYVYGSIWDGSSWATEGGKYKANYTYQPFVSKYKDFKISGCAPNSPATCSPVSGYPTGSTGLSDQQNAAMAWVAANHKTYDYCLDLNKNRTLTPEC